jgi:alcohol dehydrogenase
MSTSTTTSTSTMKALVYKGEGQCALEDRPIPQVHEPTDAIVKGESPPAAKEQEHIAHSVS